MLLDVHRMNNVCIEPMHMDIGKYLEAKMAKGIPRGYKNIREYLEASNAKRDIVGI